MRAIVAIDELARRAEGRGTPWTADDTRDALLEEKLRDGRERAARTGGDAGCRAGRLGVKTVMAYHTALLSVPRLAGVVVRPPAAGKRRGGGDREDPS